MSLIIVLASCQFISGPEVGCFLNRNSVSLSSCTLVGACQTSNPGIHRCLRRYPHSKHGPVVGHPIRKVRQHPLPPVLVNNTILNGVTHRSEQTEPGSVRHVMSSVSFALLPWPDVSPSAIISCREVLSLVTRASSASFLRHAFPLALLLRGLARSHVSYSAIMAVVGVAKVVANRV